ncbi:MAG TPA: ABC transporter permease [Candidatus Saccharimonadales bacterium]|nr:ABC transporter permease [Candidatus Saccharimonadales bacterium]
MKSLVKYLKIFYPSLAVMILLLIVWQTYTEISSIRQSILPPPSLVISSLFEFREIILTHTVQTVAETIIGFVLAIIIGSAIAILIFYSGLLRRAFYPLLTISQTIPIIALAPLFVLWLGFGILPKVILVAVFCLFPIAVATSDGLLNTPKHLSEYMQTIGAGRLQTLRYLNIPYALDRFFSGLKIGAVYAVTAAVIGEYVGAFKGLGVYLQTSASSHATALVFAATLVIITLSLALLGLVFFVQSRVMPWRRSDESKNQ